MLSKIYNIKYHLVVVYIICFFAFMFVTRSISYGILDSLDRYGKYQRYNTDVNKVIATNNLDNSIRKGASDLAEGIDGISDTDALKFEKATDRGLSAIQKFTNYFLGLLAMISLVYLIYAGYMLLFSAQDEKAMSKAQNHIKNVARALIGIGVSWLIISGVFRLVNTISS